MKRCIPPTLFFLSLVLAFPSLAWAVNTGAEADEGSAGELPDILQTAISTARIEHLTQADAERLFRNANDACLHEKLDECIDIYHRLLSAGYAGTDLYFNLGTALLRKNKLGPAILYLERARRVAPDDMDVVSNLDHAQKMRFDKLVGAPETAAGSSTPLTSFVTQNTRVEIWAKIFLSFWLAGWALVLLRRLSSDKVRTPMLSIGILLLVLSLVSGAILASHVYASRHEQEAIVLADVLPVRGGPNSQFKVEFEIHEGLKVQLIEREAGFQRIRLMNGLQGWVPMQGLAHVSGDAPAL